MNRNFKFMSDSLLSGLQFIGNYLPSNILKGWYFLLEEIFLFDEDDTENLREKKCGVTDKVMVF